MRFKTKLVQKPFFLFYIPVPVKETVLQLLFSFIVLHLLYTFPVPVKGTVVHLLFYVPVSGRDEAPLLEDDGREVDIRHVGDHEHGHQPRQQVLLTPLSL